MKQRNLGESHAATQGRGEGTLFCLYPTHSLWLIGCFLRDSLCFWATFDAFVAPIVAMARWFKRALIAIPLRAAIFRASRLGSIAGLLARGICCSFQYAPFGDNSMQLGF